MQAQTDDAAHARDVIVASHAINLKGVGMQRNQGETWDFQVHCHEPVDQIFLVSETADGTSAWIPMVFESRGLWSIRMHLAAGWYRFKYYTASGSTYFNCGSYGLIRTLISDRDHDVTIEPFSNAASA
ncbi:hypothetical protein KS4_15330 [Poriferisphaera corsica]|uniref:Uncharacterized protein n=1 Tax=Poriferisphaera corsica TaxID=2528020 RepID=A0A517YTC1_9BACT|nr:hypothetical protein [Poriferisphaera corsica]QDU33483.1 hypothetical protein KS4_15330 [Poriferisphaera corsica]